MSQAFMSAVVGDCWGHRAKRLLGWRLLSPASSPVHIDNLRKPHVCNKQWQYNVLLLPPSANSMTSNARKVCSAPAAAAAATIAAAVAVVVKAPQAPTHIMVGKTYPVAVL